jgi:serine/threonine-protein kinase
MSLVAGTRLGPYEITSALGAGGMGEVYRARDTKLNRDVAIKVLLPAVANDPDRLARFSREAQVLASLNHPNIAHIHGLEESNGVTALVMELVEGEDLSQRISRGPIPLDEALPIAQQIAEALEAAHDHDIIHRDLKPANIKVRPDGTVKVLDFGLAKSTGPGTRDPGSEHLANSPTLSIHATEAGLILGTAAYMSPEQAAGKAIDKRSDLWAFGVVLLEMLTGRQTFGGETVSHVLAAVLKDEPDWTALPPNTPASIRKLLRRCLEKDRKRRLDSASGARLEIDDAMSPSAAEASYSATAPRSAWSALPWAVAGALALGLALVTAFYVPWLPPLPIMPVRLSTELGADVSMRIDQGASAILSPDGTTLAFVARKTGGGNVLLYVRPLTELQATERPGTDDAHSPFFSPDGEWIAFFAEGKLKKIRVTGGTVVTLCDARDGRGGAWSEDGTIFFEPDASPGVSLLKVSSAGGAVQPASSLAEDEATQRWPQVLPGGKAVLFTGSPITGVYEDANLVVQTLATGARTVVLRGGYHGRYVASGSEGGHLVYMHDGTLFAVPFDLERLAVTGQAVPVLAGVLSNVNTGGAQFTVSASGTLVYQQGQNASVGLPVHWADQTSTTTSLQIKRANWFNLAIAPDGHRLAMQIADGSANDLWVYESTRDTLTRLTFDRADDHRPVWSPDGRRLVYASTLPGQGAVNLYSKRADGSGDTQRLTESSNRQLPGSWHPGGRLLAFEDQSPQSTTDLMILPLEGDEASGWKPGKPTVFLNSPFSEREPMFSPDGRWLAYASNESGRFEVYVRPFPGPGGKWQISSEGGDYPVWSRTKPELFYGLNDPAALRGQPRAGGQIMVVAYATDGDAFRAEKPQVWSETRYMTRGMNRMFDLHPDGARFAFAPVEQGPGTKRDTVIMVFNFLDELRRIAPVGKP